MGVIPIGFFHHVKKALVVSQLWGYFRKRISHTLLLIVTKMIKKKRAIQLAFFVRKFFDILEQNMALIWSSFWSECHGRNQQNYIEK